MTKDKDKLEVFRIADKKRPEVRSLKGSAGARGAEPEPEAATVGFPAIEGRLESGTIEAVADELRGSYEKLEEMAGGGPMKSKAAAKKAMAAYERTADLFEYLFATKSSLRR